jgi:hypothetical protein
MYYGDRLGSLMKGLFTKIAPKVIPMAKQLGMKSLGVIGGKVGSPLGDLAGGIVTAVKDRILRLINPKPTPVILPVTRDMPPSIAKTVNNAVNKKNS